MRGVESTTVLHELDGSGVLTLTLNRPERHNAWTRELEDTLFDLLEQAGESPEVRAVVVTGAGRTFCPGLDSGELDRVSQPGQGYDNRDRRKVTLPAFVPKPVVCAINGACAGLGLVLALTSDVRFAAAGAKITTAFARRGLPAEEAVSWILPRVVGHGAALDLLLSGRVVMADEAVGLGLVHRALPIDELLPAAHEYARDLAENCSPAAMAVIKRQVWDDWERGAEEARRQARASVARVKGHPDFREGVRSFVERRAPAFESLARAIDRAAVDDRPRG
ncbi:MAG TPA: enoyl-CoA hydratase-related protein [Acidimicrobiales bacterium]|jgi:enoyl-CoA hydratase/carnithine racemase|nr:enoyl-CoA hydratase-related protein [Acidimicrobiales bacterium]